MKFKSIRGNQLKNEYKNRKKNEYTNILYIGNWQCVWPVDWTTNWIYIVHCTLCLSIRKRLQLKLDFNLMKIWFYIHNSHINAKKKYLISNGQDLQSVAKLLTHSLVFHCFVDIQNADPIEIHSCNSVDLWICVCDNEMFNVILPVIVLWSYRNTKSMHIFHCMIYWIKILIHFRNQIKQ